MRLGRDGSVREHFRTLYESGALGRLTDGQLLERFATGRGEEAERSFALLVDRHGPMVLRVCRGVLGDSDAQDAFQATFLVLLRKSHGLWVRDSLGPWLHQVALRTASCARAVAARRRRHERRAAERAASGSAPHATPGDRDWEPVLHQEIGRLPERQRMVVVLCDLEGRTHVQAARQLGWPVGTVKSRLARARERLRARLIRRGLAPAGAVVAVVTSTPARAGVPAALARSTVALVRNLAVPGAVPGSVAKLAKGVLQAMILAKFRMLAVSLAAVSAALGASLLASGAGSPSPADPPQDQARQERPDRNLDVPVFEVTTGKLTVDLIERGTLEASHSANLINTVEGQTTILSLIPAGTHVKKGDLVCELDSASLREERRKQEIAAEQARSDFEAAKLARELAEIVRQEYIQGTYKQQLSAIEGEITRARTAIQKAEARIERTRRARQRLDSVLDESDEARTAAEILAALEAADRLDTAEMTLLSEKQSLDAALLKRKTLEEFTRPRATSECDLEVERTRQEELASLQIYELEKARLDKNASQIEKTKLSAPIDGMVVYANDPSLSGRALIAEGATVRERQQILSIPDLSSMRLNAKVREARIDQVAPGQRVSIRVDAFPEEILSGVVETVTPLPDPTSYFSQKLKLYTTYVRIEDGPRGLRPGMTAEATIHLGERDDVVRVPIQAVTQYDRKTQQGRVAVKTPEGHFVWRVVTLGMANDELVEVREGLEAGDLVAADPSALLGEEERRAKSGEADKPAK